MHDASHRPYAKLSELKPGDEIELDDDFTCHKRGIVTIKARTDGVLYFNCDEGEHRLDGQADDGEHCIGVYKL